MDGLFYRNTILLLSVNFYISVVVLIGAGFTSVGIGDGFNWFEFNEELYGPMAGNLRFMLLYLAIAELFIAVFAFYRKNFRVFIASGFFLVLCIGSLKFYSMINGVEVDEDLFVFFFYVGLSHIVFGIAKNIDLARNRQRFEATGDRFE